MESSIKYTVIKNKDQYDAYCQVVENLLSDNGNQDEIELLTVLIEKWDAEHQSLMDSDPITFLKTLMDQHQLKAKDLVDLLGVSKGLVSDILNRKKGLSKDIIRTLAAKFAVSQEAFNRPYVLNLAESKKRSIGQTKPIKPILHH